MELQPLSREHIDGIMEIENDSFSIPWSRGSMEKELENKLAISECKYLTLIPAS